MNVTPVYPIKPKKILREGPIGGFAFTVKDGDWAKTFRANTAEEAEAMRSEFVDPEPKGVPAPAVNASRDEDQQDRVIQELALHTEAEELVITCDAQGNLAVSGDGHGYFIPAQPEHDRDWRVIA